MAHLIFVYGTLKRGLPNHYLMEGDVNAKCVLRGNAVTAEKFPLVVASRFTIPFMLQAPGRGFNVVGELYEVDDNRLARLDELECHPRLYERRDILTQAMVDGTLAARTIQAQAYFLVNYRPHLLNLPMLKNYDDTGYVVRSVRTSNWWFEVSTDFEDDAA